MCKRIHLLIGYCLVCLYLLLCAAVQAGEAGSVSAARLIAADKEPHNWLSHGRTYAEQRYSPLADINRDNIGQLGLAWSYDIGSLRGIETTPLVVDGVLYGTASWSKVFAIDAATGRELWRYDPKVPGAKGRDACCDVVNRGVAVFAGKVYVGTLDGRLEALDAVSGELIWSVQTTDPNKPYTITGAPRVVKGRVIIGNGGADFGVRGYFSAYDAHSGELDWRFYTVPASTEGPHESAAMARAAKTWSQDTLWQAGGGGTVWDSFAYDPQLDLLYAGVGNGAVFDREIRSPGGGDNLYLSSIIALRPDSGELVWHYQTTPGDTWDYTATQHMILADMEIDGRQRQVLMQAPKNGFFYVLDRGTGELLSAENFVAVSWATHVDMKTGRPVQRSEAQWSNGEATVTPGPMGGHNWHPMSYSPRTGLVYIPSASTIQPFIADKQFEYTPGMMNTGFDLNTYLKQVEIMMQSMSVCDPSHITAWDPVAGQQRWRIDHPTPTPAGLLSTASDLLFQGSDTTFSAYDANSGKRLWQSEVGIGITAPPISYSVNGVQYVAVAAGMGGSHGATMERLDYINNGRLVAYRIGGDKTMPSVRKPARREVSVSGPQPEAKSVDEGRRLYHLYCGQCHGGAAVSSGELPDLRYASADVHRDWQGIVIGGLREDKGMASFADLLTPAQSQHIHDYVTYRALSASSFAERAATWLGKHVCTPVEWLAD